MTAKIVAVVPVMVLALGAATAVAQPTTHRFARFDQGSPMVTSAAFVSDGAGPSYLRNQQQLRSEPGYSVGTGDARVSGNRQGQIPGPECGKQPKVKADPSALAPRYALARAVNLVEPTA
jgi:hypothetical protein